MIRLTSLSLALALAADSIAADPNGQPSAKSEIRRLSVHDVGEYGAVPWNSLVIPIQPESREDRVRDLNLSIASVNLDDNPPSPHWAEMARIGRQHGKKFLPRVHFWDGNDRFEGPLRDVEVYWQRLDRFLSTANTDDFCGIVLAEENVNYAGRPQVLAELYRRIKHKYDIPVWQWWSPSSAVPGSGGWIPADGWIVDPYLMPRAQFRRYVRKYLMTGLPLVIMPWAETTATAKPLTPQQWQANQDQLDVAVEFNVPVAFYWTYGPGTGATGCSFGCDRGEPKTEIDRINHWVWDYIKRVRTLPGDYSGLPSADVGQGDTLEIGPTDEMDKLVYVDDFSSSRCIDDASISGFRDLVLDGTSLWARGFRGRDADASLVYRFAGDIPAKYPKITLSATTVEALGGQVEIALSADGKTWPIRAASSADSQRLELSSDGNEQFALMHEFWVKVRLSGDAGSDATPPARIDDLRIEAGVRVPKEPSVRLKPAPGNPGTLIYEDDFQTQRFRFTTTRTNNNHLEWSRGSIAVRMRPGGSLPDLVWHVKGDEPVQNIVVDVTGQANNGSLGTNHFLEVSTDGTTWSGEVNTVGREHNVSGWADHGLIIDLSQDRRFRKIKEFYVRLRLRAESYKDVHPFESGRITKVRIKAETSNE